MSPTSRLTARPTSRRELLGLRLLHPSPPPPLSPAPPLPLPPRGRPPLSAEQPIDEEAPPWTRG